MYSSPRSIYSLCCFSLGFFFFWNSIAMPGFFFYFEELGIKIGIQTVFVVRPTNKNRFIKFLWQNEHYYSCYTILFSFLAATYRKPAKSMNMPGMLPKTDVLLYPRPYCSPTSQQRTLTSHSWKKAKDCVRCFSPLGTMGCDLVCLWS